MSNSTITKQFGVSNSLYFLFMFQSIKTICKQPDDSIQYDRMGLLVFLIVWRSNCDVLQFSCFGKKNAPTSVCRLKVIGKEATSHVCQSSSALGVETK